MSWLRTIRCTMSVGEKSGDSGLSGEVKRERDRFVAFAFSAADAFVELDGEKNIRYVTGAVNALTGKAGNSLNGQNFLDLIVPEERALASAGFDIAIKQGRCGPLHLRLKQDSDEPLYIELRGTYLPINGGGLFLSLNRGTAAVGNSVDLIDKEKFAEIAHDAIGPASSGDRPAVLTMLDLEGLTALIGRMDEDGAARLMSDINGYIQAQAIDGGTAAHVGNDMFGVVHDPDADIVNLEEMITVRAKATDPDGTGVTVNAASVDLGAEELSDFDDAKALLYTINKFSEKRSKFTVKDLQQGYQAMLEEVRSKIVSFKKTVTAGEFEVFFQPIVELTSRDVDHYEALLRLPGAGPEDSPYSFISFAEDAGVIADFDLAMCARVMRFLETVKKQDRELSVAVNVSGRSLETPAFLEKLIQLLGHFSPPRHWLQFEVTESSTIHDLETTGKFLNSLRKLGHKVCLDDFGSGSAAFQYLRALEVDCVKIDGIYVKEAQESDRGKAFLRTIATLCKDLEIDTVGEMVELEASAKFLIEIGVRYGQGYLFGRPVKDISGWRPNERQAS